MFKQIRRFSIPAIWLFLLLGLVWTPYSASDQSFRDLALVGASMEHWLGVDGLGRDFLTRIWLGAANSIWLSASALIISLLISSGLLALQIKTGPRFGSLIKTAVGLWVAVPVIFIGLLLLVVFSPSPFALVCAVGLGNVPLTFRQLSVHWRELQRALFVQASIVLGSSAWMRFRYTVWPNLLPDLISLSKLVFALSLLELSGLAFLGLIGDPDFAELGAILKQNQAYLYKAPHLVFLPGLVIAMLLFTIHLKKVK